MKPKTRKVPAGLPAFLRWLFWEYDFRKLTWKRDWALAAEKILSRGDWKAVCWLRRKLGDEALRQYIVGRQGKGLTRKQVRYWELILQLPAKQVNVWLADPRRTVWDRRNAL